jgi:flagella basal body P-ring formation protein FlgA
MRRKDCEISARAPGRPVGAVGLVLAVVGLTALTAAAPAAPKAVRIWTRALVNDTAVRLGDVAQLSGFDDPTRTTLADFVIAEAPEPGHRLVIDHRELIAKLRAAGLNLAEVRISGATACEVSRPTTPEQREPEVLEMPAGRTFVAAPGARARQQADRTLEGAVREHIGAVLAEYGGEVEVNFNRSGELRSALSLSEPRFAFRIQTDGSGPLGLLSLRVDVLENGRVVQTVPVVAEVALVRRVVVARRPINRGMTIDERDVALAERRFTSLEGIGVTDLASLIGQQSRRFVGRGEMLTARDVKPVPLVKRGELVTVYHRQGGILIKTVGKALGGGSYGEAIAVKNEGSKRSYDATITGPQTVEVRSSEMLLASGVGP